MLPLSFYCHLIVTYLIYINNQSKQAQKGFRPLSAIFVIIFLKFWGGIFGISLGIFLEDFFGGYFFDRIFLVEFFVRNFLGGYFSEDF